MGKCSTTIVEGKEKRTFSRVPEWWNTTSRVQLSSASLLRPCSPPPPGLRGPGIICHEVSYLIFTFYSIILISLLNFQGRCVVVRLGAAEHRVCFSVTSTAFRLVSLHLRFHENFGVSRVQSLNKCNRSKFRTCKQ